MEEPESRGMVCASLWAAGWVWDGEAEEKETEGIGRGGVGAD